MLLSDYDAAWAANEFIDYFGRFKTIEDYVRLTKEAAIDKRGASLYSLKDEFFNSDIHPNDMEFSIMPIGARTGVFHTTHALSQPQFFEYLTATSSHVIEHNLSLIHI